MEEMIELIKSIKNRCNIILCLYRFAFSGEVEEGIPTLLEDLYLDAQALVEDFCQEDKRD